MRKVGRRAAFGVWASGLMGVTSACSDRNVTVIEGPDGKVLQLEQDDFLVLVSDFKQQYQPGDRITINVLINNQNSRFATARIRTRLLGRGQQAVVEAEVASVNIRPMDATTTERTLLLPNDLPAGDYTLQVELPPWSFEGRQAGGGSLTTSIKVGA
ncbi:MAG: hypothetical protein AB7P40_16800 [Chloroflexota bacterium]